MNKRAYMIYHMG